MERAWPWAIRLVWVTLPVAIGPLIDVGLEKNSRSVQLVLLVLSWAVWGCGLVAVLVFHPIGLVGLRVATASALVFASVLAVRIHSAADRSIVGVGASLIAVMVTFAAETGHLCVNGPAYPNERRFLLRPPAVMLLGAIPVAGALVGAGVVAGPLLLAAKSWVAGVIVLLVGAGGAFVGARSLYGFTRRFVVFVPAGFVLHDLAVIREPVLFRKQTVESISPADAAADALDLTATAPGLAVEVRLHEKTEITRITRRNDPGDTGSTARFLIMATLPGRLVGEARARNYETGYRAVPPPITTSST